MLNEDPVTMTETRSQRLGRLSKKAAITLTLVAGVAFAAPVFAHQTETGDNRLDAIGGSVIDQIDGNALSQTLATRSAKPSANSTPR